MWSTTRGPAKGVGSAQRRTRGRVLHHGSIKLGTTPLEGDIARVDRQLAGLDARAIAPALRRAIERGLDVRIEAGVPTAREREAARVLGARYVDLEPCGSCEVLAINGLRCHEAGCPEAWRDASPECRECGQAFAPEERLQVCCSPCCAMAYGGFSCDCDNCREVSQ